MKIIANSVKFSSIDDFDFTKLDEIQKALHTIKTEADALKFMKKFNFKGDNYYSPLKDNQDLMTHISMGISVPNQFFISVHNTVSGNGTQIILDTKGKEVFK